MNIDDRGRSDEIARGDPGLADKPAQNRKVSVPRRNVAIFLHMDATVDNSELKIVKAMFPNAVGTCAGPGG